MDKIKSQSRQLNYPNLKHCLVNDNGRTKLFNFIPNGLPLKSAIVSSLLLACSMPTFALTYTWQEIPAPSQIIVPAGNSVRKVCTSINAIGQVACNLQIIETLTQTALDRGRVPKLFASFAYKWDSRAATNSTNPLLLSTTAATNLDTANVINDSGIVAGTTNTTLTKKPQGTIWTGSTPALVGPGVVNDLDNSGNYILNNRLFVNGRAITFPGAQVKVQAINPVASLTTRRFAGGTQSFSSTLGESGTGLLYSTRPTTTTPHPWFALSSILADFEVQDITDNGNYVMSGIRGTAGGLFTYSCAAGSVTNCQVYFPTVGAANANRSPRWIALNSVNSSRNAVGIDGGIGIRIDPPSARFPNGNEVFLSLEPGVGSSGLTISEGTGINNSGQIIGSGLLGRNRSAFLLTPQ
jgi:hypothetical protein